MNTEEHARQAIERDLAENPDLDPRRRSPEEQARRTARNKAIMRERMRRVFADMEAERPDLAKLRGGRQS